MSRGPGGSGGRVRRVRELFLAACEVPADERGAWLDARCAGDDALRREVEGLLEEDEARPTSFLAPPTRASEPLPDRIGPYRVRSLLGAGGMGLVYEAEQERPHRAVALKVLRSGGLDERAQRRFEFEAELLGRLEHPGIARIYEAGSVREGPLRLSYLAMELVRGEPLTRFVRDAGLDVPARLELFATLCDVVQHAHHNGVIHRDLKPANVLVGAGGPKVLDFGIALAEDQEARLTVEASGGASGVLGTLQYMSPEQAAGGAVDARTDVYALGVMLHELLTDTLPYDLAGEPVAKALQRITSEEPRRLGVVRPEFAGDLEWIVAKVLQKDADARYQSAAELGADVRRFLADEPIAARPPSRVDAARKFVRRNRALVVGIASTIVALAVGLALALQQARRATRGWDLAARRNEDLLSLSTGVDLRDLEVRARELWPAEPARVADYRAWLADADRLASRREEFERTLADLVQRATAGADGGLQFAATRDRWWHEQLTELLERLDRLEDPETGLIDGLHPKTGPGIARRLARAQSLGFESLESDAARARWAEACAALACAEVYGGGSGLEITPQLGLLPLGPDPDTGFWEFVHVASGDVPRRGEDGRLQLEESHGVVLVLLPGGAYFMGSQPLRADLPNYDLAAKNQEAPMHREEVEPFFLGKHELTQGQWVRFTGHNPSRYSPDYWPDERTESSLLHPGRARDLGGVCLRARGSRSAPAGRGRMGVWRPCGDQHPVVDRRRPRLARRARQPLLRGDPRAQQRLAHPRSARLGRRRLGAARPGRLVPAEPVRPARPARQRLGVDPGPGRQLRRLDRGARDLPHRGRAAPHGAWWILRLRPGPGAQREPLELRAGELPRQPRRAGRAVADALIR